MEVWILVYNICCWECASITWWKFNDRNNDQWSELCFSDSLTHTLHTNTMQDFRLGHYSFAEICINVCFTIWSILLQRVTFADLLMGFRLREWYIIGCCHCDCWDFDCCRLWVIDRVHRLDSFWTIAIVLCA